jgi:hypothetical protein
VEGARHGPTVTVNAVDVTPPDDAVIAVVPTNRELISPLLETVATTVLLDTHEKVTPCRTWPDASFATAVACIVVNMAIEDDGALTVIVATGGLTTVTVSALDVTEPAVAVMLTVPGATPVTTPFPSTVATEGLLALQLKVGEASVSAPASSATARSGSVA